MMRAPDRSGRRKRSNDFPIRNTEGEIAEITEGHPAPLLVFERLGLSSHEPTDKGVQCDAEVTVGMLQIHQTLADLNVKAQLPSHLTSQAFV
jgi:hypothetical protein